MKRTKNYCQLHGNATPVEIAKNFLWAEGYQDKGIYLIKFYRKEFYLYENTHYRLISDDALLIEILSFLQDQKALTKKATRHHANNVLLNIAALVKISDTIEVPCFLNNPKNKRSRLISFKNGIFDLDLYMKGKRPLGPHTPDFFSLSSLPFPYNSKAKCPIWKRFLNKVLPDQEIQRLLQEWFGYNMTYDVSHQKLVLMVGSGGDGKSVISTVQTELLGKENVSAVSLEQFNPSRTFPLYEMLGKLANIVGEIGDLNKVAEGILKNIVAGGEMTVERKGRDPVLAKFTVKLTFLTNVVPRFRDRTDGLWRRIIFIPFNVQTLDPKKQNRNYVNGSWWVNSGEIQGITNWALAGLVRLTKRGYFVEPKSSIAMKEEYKAEANPAVTFLKENYEIKAGGNLSSHDLYSKYSAAIKALGGIPLGQHLFTREVKKAFRQARLSVNPRAVLSSPAIGGYRVRARVWENLRSKK